MREAPVAHTKRVTAHLFRLIYFSDFSIFGSRGRVLVSLMHFESYIRKTVKFVMVNSATTLDIFGSYRQDGLVPSFDL